MSEHFLPLFEGFMPLQLLVEFVGLLWIMGGLSLLLEKAGWRVGLLTKAAVVFLVIFVWLKYRVYPPMPFTILATYLVVSLAAILLWVSSSEKSWQEFRRPIIAVLDAETTLTQVTRAGFLVLLPLLAGLLTWNSLRQTIEAPVELRTVGPAPPGSFRLHGKEIVLQAAQNPYRVNPKGLYDPHYMFEPSTGRMIEMGKQEDVWTAADDQYLIAVREGGHIYFQECVFCHGANLNGQGIFAHAFRKPFPTNFTDPGTIAQHQESYEFWRTATGGMNLPNEGFPWLSTMPRMEEHLSPDDIWKVILFSYWHTGWVPRTWD